MITIQIPTALRKFANNQSSVTVNGNTVGEALADFAATYPEAGKHIMDADGKPRNFVNLYIGDENIRHLQGLDTAVSAGQTILLVPSIAGGAGVAAQGRSGTDVARLSAAELRRYSRHIILPEVGRDGQEKLKAASVLIIGAGGLGAPLSMYLTSAGVGRIGLADFDVVDESNLQRQVIYTVDDIGKTKCQASRDRLVAMNPNVDVELHEGQFTSETAMTIAENYDIVIDGTDNFPTRYLCNDISVLLKKPNVYGSIFRFEGQATVFDPARGGPCYRCLYPEPPPPGMVPSCAEGGVLGVLPGIVGMIQATEAIKLIIGSGETLLGRLLLFDALSMQFRELKLRRDPQCPICGDHPTISGPIDYEQFCGIVPREEDAMGIPTITVGELKERIDRGDRPFILDVREPFEYEIANIGGTLIPLGDLAERLGELDANQEMVVHCKMGGRSARAVDLLRQHGFKYAKNLEGGINAWREEIDPDLEAY